MQISIEDHHALILYYVLTQLSEQSEESVFLLEPIADLLDLSIIDVDSAISTFAETLEDRVLDPIK